MGLGVLKGRGMALCGALFLVSAFAYVLVGNGVPASADPLGNISIITEEPGGCGAPDACGNWVVWTADGEDGVTYAYLYNAVSGDIRQIGSQVVGRPRIADGLVVWLARAGKEDLDVECHDIAEAKTFRLDSEPGLDLAPHTSDGVVVWWCDKGETATIWLYDHAARDYRVVVEGKSRDFGLLAELDFDSGRVVYSYGNEEEAEIYVYDVATGVTHQLTSNEYADFDPYVSADLVAWRGYPVSGAGIDNDEVYAHWLGDGLTRRLTDNAERETGLRATPKGVVWVQQQKYRGTDVYFWEKGASQPRRISWNPYMEAGLCPDGDWLAWEMGSSSLPGEIILCHLPSGVTRRITQDYVGDAAPTLGDGLLAWVERRNGVGQIAVMEFDALEAPIPDPVHFPDIDVSPYRESIEDMLQRQVVSGFEDGSFRPDAPIARAQSVKMLAVMLKLPVAEGMPSPFWDVGANDPSTLYPNDYIVAAWADAWTHGVTATSFAPWRSLSRAQMVTLVIRAGTLHVSDLVTPPDGFVSTLGNFDPAHAAAMSIAEYNGVLAGLEGFGPDWDPWQPATRGEMASVLWFLWMK